MFSCVFRRQVDSPSSPRPVSGLVIARLRLRLRLRWKTGRVVLSSPICGLAHTGLTYGFGACHLVGGFGTCHSGSGLARPAVTAPHTLSGVLAPNPWLPMVWAADYKGLAVWLFAQRGFRALPNQRRHPPQTPGSRSAFQWGQWADYGGGLEGGDEIPASKIGNRVSD
jgi:hypothetical protein